jgi:hypothetical protein
MTSEVAISHNQSVLHATVYECDYFFLHILSHEHMIMHAQRVVYVKKGYMVQSYHDHSESQF